MPLPGILPLTISLLVVLETTTGLILLQMTESPPPSTSVGSSLRFAQSSWLASLSHIKDRLIFGCEDLNLGAGNADRDYNDVMFLINIDGDWDDTYVPNLNCTGDDCTVYKCEATTVTYTGTEFTADVEITYEGREVLPPAESNS